MPLLWETQMGSKAKRKLGRRRERKVKRIKPDRTSRKLCSSDTLCTRSADPRTHQSCGIMDLPDLAMQLVFSILGVGRLRAAQGRGTQASFCHTSAAVARHPNDGLLTFTHQCVIARLAYAIHLHSTGDISLWLGRSSDDSQDRYFSQNLGTDAQN